MYIVFVHPECNFIFCRLQIRLEMVFHTGSRLCAIFTILQTFFLIHHLCNFAPKRHSELALKVGICSESRKILKKLFLV